MQSNADGKWSDDENVEKQISDASEKPEEDKEREILSAQLAEKKREVILRLIEQLSHKNRGDLEMSLSAMQILVDLIELEKTCALFFDNEGEFVRKLMKLAIDPSNAHN